MLYVKTHVNHKIHEMDPNEEHLGRKHMEYCDVSLVIALEQGHLCDHKYIEVRVRDQIAT